MDQRQYGVKQDGEPSIGSRHEEVPTRDAGNDVVQMLLRSARHRDEGTPWQTTLAAPRHPPDAASQASFECALSWSLSFGSDSYRKADVRRPIRSRGSRRRGHDMRRFSVVRILVAAAKSEVASTATLKPWSRLSIRILPAGFCHYCFTPNATAYWVVPFSAKAISSKSICRRRARSSPLSKLQKMSLRAR
jgi:hypothetical protein